MASEMLRLKNGSEVFRPAVVVTMEALKSLLKEHPIAFYELVMISRDRGHRLFGNTAAILQDRSLIESDGHPHSIVSDVVLSAVSGEGFGLHLGNPISVQVEATNAPEDDENEGE